MQKDNVLQWIRKYFEMKCDEREVKQLQVDTE